MTPPRALFSAVLASSVALHGVAFVVLPEGRRHPGALPPTVIEIADVPAPPPPLRPPPPEPTLDKPFAAPDRAPLVARSTAPNRSAPTAPASTNEAPASIDEAPAGGAPVDFTSSVLSSADGRGVAMPSSGATTTAAAVRTAPPRGPELVALGDLSQPPRAPRLDLVLERNYPPDARRSGVTGNAVLAVQILADGSVGGVRRISQSHASFAAACERTVRSGAWSPPLDRAGRRVATLITYTCRFEVKG